MLCSGTLVCGQSAEWKAHGKRRKQARRSLWLGLGGAKEEPPAVRSRRRRETKLVGDVASRGCGAVKLEGQSEA